MNIGKNLVSNPFRTTKLDREKRTKRKKIKRYALIGAATGLGGVLIGIFLKTWHANGFLGLTGGLAAPLIAGAATTLGIGAAAGIGTIAGSAVVGSVFGVAGAGLTGYKMKKRVGAIEEFIIESLTNELSLHVVLCVSGWIDNVSQDFNYKRKLSTILPENYFLLYLK